jgi:hypothetical protein
VTAPDDAVVHKRDLFGTLRRLTIERDAKTLDCAERDTGDATRGFGWLARRLAAREARALEALRELPQVPRLLTWNGRMLQRSWLPGLPLHRATPPARAYFREALTLVRRMHAAGVVHNDLAKEPNWLVGSDGRPALVDFQLAMRPRYRGRLFRMLAYDDLRHLLKHKRSYAPEALTPKERKVLAKKSAVASVWLKTGKKVYQAITRGIFNFTDREGGDRSDPDASHAWLEVFQQALPRNQFCAAGKLVARAYREEFDEDPDFEEAYFRGVYDVKCHTCDGLRVVLVRPEIEREFEGEPKHRKLQRALLAELRSLDEEQADYERERAAERRMGA